MRYLRHITLRRTLLMSLLWLVPAINVKADNIENLARSLAKLRGEVEMIQTELDAEKEKHASKIASLSSQLADLSVEERRQKTAIEKLEHTLDQLSEVSQKAEQSGEKLKPALLAALANYKHYVFSGFPFKRDDRIAAIETLEENIINQQVDPNKAVNQTWALIEDEIRLSKENGLYQQTISLEGEKILADVAKLGTVFLFFQTRDNRAGMAKQAETGEWKFEVTDASGDIEQIALLFDSLKKQIRQGYFELPNPLKK